MEDLHCSFLFLFMPVYVIPEDEIVFPHPLEAEPEGLLGIGGDLEPARLLLAYQYGIFPWYTEGSPIHWWFTHPRCILYPEKLKVSKSMRPYFNQGKFRVSYNQAFSKVIEMCKKSPRKDQESTWITDDMKSAYIRMHELGIAHSVEVWDNKTLVGGVYGLSLGKIFYGESMFSKVTNASKFGFIHLVEKLKEKRFKLIDCQQQTDHLISLGAEMITGELFLNILEENREYKNQLLIF